MTGRARRPEPQATDATATHAAGDTESLEAAIASAAYHARAALAETLLLLRALLDVASFLALGRGAARVETLRSAVELLEQIQAGVRPGSDPAQDLLTDLADALDAEITRWESRSQGDPEARAVLRAFLGLRELLWEFGIASPGPQPHPERATA